MGGRDPLCPGLRPGEHQESPSVLTRLRGRSGPWEGVGSSSGHTAAGLKARLVHRPGWHPDPAAPSSETPDAAFGDREPSPPAPLSHSGKLAQGPLTLKGAHGVPQPLISGRWETSSYTPVRGKAGLRHRREPGPDLTQRPSRSQACSPFRFTRPRAPQPSLPPPLATSSRTWTRPA